MNTPPLLLTLLLFSALNLHGQLRSPGSYTQRVAPRPGSQSTTRPGPPASSTAPAPAVITTLPAAPVDPEKLKAMQDETVRKTIDFQHRRALGGSPSAQYDLGMRYLTGDGVEKNEKTALKWINASATNGNAQAIKKMEELEKAKKPAKEEAAAR